VNDSSLIYRLIGKMNVSHTTKVVIKITRSGSSLRLAAYTSSSDVLPEYFLRFQHELFCCSSLDKILIVGCSACLNFIWNIARP